MTCRVIQDDDIINVNDKVLANLEKRVHKNATNSSYLDHMNQALASSYPVLVATKPEFMRAIDYRAPTLGMVLIIAKPFDHTRQLLQGLGRVGRNGDESRRVKLQSIDLIDIDKNMTYLSNLTAFHSTIFKKVLFGRDKGGKRGKVNSRSKKKNDKDGQQAQLPFNNLEGKIISNPLSSAQTNLLVKRKSQMPVEY